MKARDIIEAESPSGFMRGHIQGHVGRILCQNGWREHGPSAYRLDRYNQELLDKQHKPKRTTWEVRRHLDDQWTVTVGSSAKVYGKWAGWSVGPTRCFDSTEELLEWLREKSLTRLP